MKKMAAFISIALLGYAASGATQTTTSGGEPVVQVTSVATSDDDLLVTIEWDSINPLPSSATLVVRTTAGIQRASQPLTPSPGGSQVQLVNVLGPYDIGQTLSASVVDANQEPLSALPFDLVLDCSTPYECGLRARPGMGAAPDVPITSPELHSQMMASAQTPPTARLGPDVLGDVQARRPDLAGEVYTYAHKLSQLASGPVGPAPAECICFWNVANFLIPSAGNDHSHNADPAFYSGKEGPGAAHWLKAWYDGGLFNATHDAETYVEGETETTMRLRCWRILGWREVVIRLFWFEIRIKIPVIEGDCPKPCQGTVDNHGEYYANVKAWVDSGAWGDAQAAAQEEGLYTVNGNALINRISRVGKEVRKAWNFSLAVPGLGSVTTDNGNVSYDGTPTDNLKIEIKYEVNGNDGTVSNAIVGSDSLTVLEPATASFEAKALAFAHGSSDSEAEGKATMSYMYTMFGVAACARPQTAAMWNYYSYDGRTKQLQDNIKAFFAQFGKPVNP